MTQPTYLFYDLETTGLNKCFDQVLQFAAIRTDLALNEIARHHINVRLNCDVIPAPTALLTHRMKLQDIQTGQPEIDAMREIHQLMNTPGTISLGYNTLGFDDELLRFSFYRNLLSPYTHQYANQCKRMDLYPITTLYYLFKPDSLQWPIRDGKISLKLENLIQENQLTTGPAHNAMVDVTATLALAKKFIQHEEMWHYVIGYFDKHIDIQRCVALPMSFESSALKFHESLIIHGNFGSHLHYQVPALSLGQHQYYKNQSLWLRLDSETLQQTTPETIPTTTYVIRKRAGEQPIVLPTFNRFLAHLSPERQELANANKAWLQTQSHLLAHICDYHQTYQYPPVKNLDIDAALYDIGFPSPQEEKLFQQFHTVPPHEKEKIVTQFPNPIRQQQALRLLGRHYPKLLSQESRSQFAEYLKNIDSGEEKFLSTDYKNQPRLTSHQALQEILHLKKEISGAGEIQNGKNQLRDEEQLQLLTELESYLLNRRTCADFFL